MTTIFGVEGFPPPSEIIQLGLCPREIKIVWRAKNCALYLCGQYGTFTVREGASKTKLSEQGDTAKALEILKEWGMA